MSKASEFLEGWFAAFYRFDGLILVLQAFFDETGGHESHEIAAVAGFVYDKPCLMAFTEAWEPKVASLSAHDRSSCCHAGQGPFRSDDWPECRRHTLMDTLATLGADQALAAFVVSTGRDDFEAAKENIPNVRKFLDSPYSMCAVSILAMVSTWAESTCPEKGAYFWFESGGPGEMDTVELVARLISDPETREAFPAIKGRAWIRKQEALALCSADLLAWEWQRNARKSPGLWTPRMEGLIEEMSVHPKKICAHHITGNELTSSALSNVFPGLFG